MSKEQRIIKQLKSGDKEPLAVMYSKHREEFISWMKKKYNCDQEESRDLYQYAVLAFYKNVMEGKLESIESTIKTYLFSIGKNKFLGNQKQRSRFTFDFEESFIDFSGSDKAEKLREEREVKLVHECLNDLGDPCKALIQMTYFLKLSMEEICKRLGYKNSETAKNVKYKCMQRMRKLFSERILVINKEDAYGF